MNKIKKHKEGQRWEKARQKQQRRLERKRQQRDGGNGVQVQNFSGARNSPGQINRGE
jgi:hypothetical protein